MAAITTKEFEDETISWLHNDTNLFCLNILSSLALSLIARVAANPVAICGQSIDKKAMQIIFCLVFTFNHVANKLFSNLKNIVHNKKKPPSNFLTLAHVQSHNYNQDSNEENIKIPFLFQFSSTICLFVFVRSAYDTNNVSYKFFVALPAHQARAKNSRDKLQKKHSNTLSKQVIHHLFLYKAHRFLYYCNPPIVATE